MPLPLKTRTRGRIAWRMSLLALMLATLGVLVWGWNDFSRFSNTALQLSARGESIDVERGTSFRNIVANLHQAGEMRGEITLTNDSELGGGCFSLLLP